MLVLGLFCGSCHGAGLGFPDCSRSATGNNSVIFLYYFTPGYKKQKLLMLRDILGALYRYFLLLKTGRQKFNRSPRIICFPCRIQN